MTVEAPQPDSHKDVAMAPLRISPMTMKPLQELHKFPLAFSFFSGTLFLSDQLLPADPTG